MADLSDNQASVRLCSRCQLFERLESFTRELCFARDNGVAHGFQLVVFNHEIPCQDLPKFAFTPSLIDIDEVLGRNTSCLEVLWVPRRETLCHCCLQESVLSCLARELEFEGFTQCGSIRAVGLISCWCHCACGCGFF